LKTLCFEREISGASLYAVNLRNAQLLRTDLSRTTCETQNLSTRSCHCKSCANGFVLGQTWEANLTGAIFKGTILLDADLKKRLAGAFFTGAILRGRNGWRKPFGADLRGALGITCSRLFGVAWALGADGSDLTAEVQVRCGSSSNGESIITQRQETLADAGGDHEGSFFLALRNR